MIYVDMLIAYGKSATWKYDESCHLFADTQEELHTFAQKIGLKREWFQDHDLLAHYDLTKSKRAQAVKAGAKEVDRKFLIQFMDNLKKINP